MDRRVATLAVGLLVLLAGCNLGGGGATGSPTGTATHPDPSPQTPRETASPSPVPTATATAMRSPTASPTTASATPPGDLDPLSSMPLPPGVTAEGVDIRQLVGAHTRGLASIPHRTEYVIVNGTHETRVNIANSSARLGVQVNDLGRDGHTEYYVEGRELGTRNTTSGGIFYGYGPLASRQVVLRQLQSLRQLPARYVTAITWTPVGVDIQRGQQYAILNATGVNESRLGASGPVTAVTGRMAVTSGGRIAIARLRYEIERNNGSTVTRGIDVATTAIGTARLERPRWLETAPRLRPAVAAEGKLLVVEHAGGVPIPAGTPLTISRGRSLLGSVSPDAQFAPGETLYLYRTRNESQSTLRATVGTRPSLPENATAFQGRLAIGGRLAEVRYRAGVVVAE